LPPAEPVVDFDQSTTKTKTARLTFIVLFLLFQIHILLLSYLTTFIELPLSN